MIWKQAVVWYILLVGLGLVMSRFFQAVLLEWLSIFLLPGVWLLLAILVLVGLGWAIGFGLRHSRRQRWVPLGLLLGVLLLTVLVPWANLWLTWNFQWHRQARVAVVQQLQQGSLPTQSGIWPLPDPYRATSMGGEIQVERRDNQLYVMFFTLRSLGFAAGYLYSESDQPPPTDLFSGYGLHQARSVGEGWYYVQVADL